jgi:hypothetical protein
MSLSGIFATRPLPAQTEAGRTSIPSNLSSPVFLDQLESDQDQDTEERHHSQGFPHRSTLLSFW